jgi:hypothetical protein
MIILSVVPFVRCFFSWHVHYFLNNLSNNLRGRWFRMSSDLFNELRKVLTCIHFGHKLIEHLLLCICKEFTLFLDLTFDSIEVYH